MAKKKYYAILETVATNKNMAADIAIIICDKEGKIFNQMAVVIKECYSDLLLQNNLMPVDCYDYTGKLNSGMRMLASVVAVNHWIRQAFARYNPELISWGLLVHSNRCASTGIELNVFDSKICLCAVVKNTLFNSTKFFKFSGLNVGALDSMASGDCSVLDLMTVFKFFSEKEKGIECAALEKARDVVMPVLCSLIKKRRWRAIDLQVGCGQKI